MRKTIVRIGIAGAGAMLALGLVGFAPPAGAAGSHGVNSEDSTCFTANGPQGRSHSDPDGMSNGGADKPGCPGGFDADQDGNNGCGNDADREDDNNGHCGNGKGHDNDGAAPVPPSSTTTTTTTTTTTAPDAVAAPAAGPEVEPAVELTDCQIDPKEATDCPDSTSAGLAGSARLAPAGDGATAETVPSDVSSTAIATEEAPASSSATPGTTVLGETLTRPAALARTGAGVGALTLLGLGLFGGGRLTALARRLTRIG